MKHKPDHRQINTARIAHIINPVKAETPSDLVVAQPITFESMRLAANNAREKGIEVELWSTSFPEDLDVVPDHFQKTAPLARSVLDMGNFSKPRKLPFLHDILIRLYEFSSADYFIYTNVDIALQKKFYRSVVKMIQRYDAFAINRRTLPATYSKPDELPTMYRDKGKRHPGLDCFVFPRSFVPKLILHHIAIGANYIGKSMALNLALIAKNFHVYRKKHLTFHIGEDRVWKSPQYSEFGQFNFRQYQRILQDLKRQHGRLYVENIKFYYFDNPFRKPFNPKILQKWTN